MFTMMTSKPSLTHRTDDVEKIRKTTVRLAIIYFYQKSVGEKPFAGSASKITISSNVSCPTIKPK